MPVSSSDAPLGRAAGSLVSVAALAAVAVVIVREVRRSEHDRRLRPVHLVLAIELVLVAFSMTYYLVARHDPTEFVGLRTRLDALYFSLTTTTTVGYGDITAAGQRARLFVTVQLGFTLVFVGVIVGLLKDQLQQRNHRRHPDDEPARR